MPQHHHQTFDSDGNLIEEVIEEYEPTDPEPTDAERIDALAAELADIRERVARIEPSNTDVRAMRDAITGES